MAWVRAKRVFIITAEMYSICTSIICGFPFRFFFLIKSMGILADCGSLMSFNDDSRGSYLYFDTAEQIDYYFIAGETADEIISGYRTLTGRAAILPKWAYGYVQSKEAYRTQEELVKVAEEYRKRRIGLDCVVQDWNTWEDGAWGNKIVDKMRYPDLAEMNQKLHDMHVHSMVSVWPNMNAGTDNYEEMQTAGYLLNDYATYDAFDEGARELYWKQAEKELFSGGFDSWWCDSTEPFPVRTGTEKFRGSRGAFPSGRGMNIINF